MFQNINIFQRAYALASYAGARQALIARNVAQSDTPGYVPRDLPPFAQMVARDATGSTLRRTRAGHIAPATPAQALAEPRAGARASPNRNAVSIEEEMMQSVGARREHDRALMLYRSGLRILRTSLGRN